MINIMKKLVIIMSNYKIKAVIKSEAIFGSGKSKGQINEDSKYDEDGFVYYSGKTLKGMIKKTSNLIIDNCKEFENFDELKGIYDKLFGKENSKIGKENSENSGKIHFSNLEISKEMKNKLLNEFKLTSSEILSAMTNIRNFIKIDNEKGVTAEGSLRNIRTIKENMVFFSDLGELNLEDKEKKFLALVVRNTKNLGMNISKGRGEVKLTLLEDGEELEVTAKEVIK